MVLPYKGHTDKSKDYITVHSPSVDFLMFDRDTRSFLLVGPPFLRSSSRSRALGKFCAVKIHVSRARKAAIAGYLQAARQYHRLASSRLAGAPIPTSVK